MRWPAHSGVLDHFGGFLAGVAALLAIVFAAVKGSQELDEWKHRRRDEKASEVAGQTSVAAIKFEEALQLLVLPFARTDDRREAEFEQLIAGGPAG